MASHEYRSAFNRLQAHIDEQTMGKDQFSLADIGVETLAWLKHPDQAALRDAIDAELIDQMSYGFAQRAVARHRSGKILYHGQVRNLNDWKLELHQRILVIQGWKELIVKGGKFRPGQHKDLLEMTGTDFAAAALNRRLRAKVENDIADLWDQVGRDIGMKKVKEVFPTIEEFAAHTLVLQGVDIPTS